MTPDSTPTQPVTEPEDARAQHCPKCGEGLTRFYVGGALRPHAIEDCMAIQMLKEDLAAISAQEPGAVEKPWRMSGEMADRWMASSEPCRYPATCVASVEDAVNAGIVVPITAPQAETRSARLDALLHDEPMPTRRKGESTDAALVLTTAADARNRLRAKMRAALAAAPAAGAEQTCKFDVYADGHVAVCRVHAGTAVLCNFAPAPTNAVLPDAERLATELRDKAGVLRGVQSGVIGQIVLGQVAAFLESEADRLVLVPDATAQTEVGISPGLGPTSAVLDDETIWRAVYAFNLVCPLPSNQDAAVHFKTMQAALASRVEREAGSPK